ncbi:MMPL family transporter [Clostridiaceae bacterium M8S5]|nr:MMPL family transporter [Clostridiaceae bacterium M8S5]
MYRVSKFIVNHTKAIIALYLVLMIIGGILSTQVSINLNNASYLPDSMNSKKAVIKLGEEFGIKGVALILLEHKEIYEVEEIKNNIKKIQGVKDVIWLDDFTDINMPLEFIDKEYIKQFYKNKNALLQVLFEDIDESEDTHKGIEEIETIIDSDSYISGTSIMSKNMIDRSNREVIIYSLVAVALVLIILLISTSSWIEPFIFITTIIVSILINMGLNIFKGEVSQVTYSAASILQFAVSMDYMIFLLHRFHDERKKVSTVKEAMINSLMLSYKSIVASGVTTIAGFIALTFMDFGIGKDLGFVLARGVFLSLITVLTFLPATIVILEKWIEKFRHKEIAPKFNYVSRIPGKGRYAFVIILFVLAGLFYLAQSNIEYYYDNSNVLPIEDSSLIARDKINEEYGNMNKNIIIIPSGDDLKESSLVKELSNSRYINNIESLYSITKNVIADFMIPKEIKDKFTNGKYSIININLSTGVEDKEAFEATFSIRNIVGSYYKEYYIAGEAFTYKDLKDVTDNDFYLINIISIVFILIILMVTFKSILIPFIAVFVIEASIWINVGMAYFLQSKMSFISFIIIGAIQLGATVDYAILYINRYKENRESMTPIEAAKETFRNTAKSILVSGSILVTATFSIYFIATIRTASEICLLIGRGGIISMFNVLFVLPGFLIIADSLISKITVKWKINNHIR